MVILDGPLGTELAARGVSTELPEWSARGLVVAPEVVSAIHGDYRDAGATVHTANTFRTRRRQVGERWEELARLAVSLARGAVGPGMRVAGSIAPLEDCYRPDLSPEDPRPEHAELARVLASAGCDLLLCETFPHLGEALVAVEEAVRTGVETWVSFTAGPDATLLTPAAMREGARAAVERGARAVLVNCVPAHETTRFLEALAHEGVPFGAYANAGCPDDRIGWRAAPDPQRERQDPNGPARYGALAREWIALGATIVGGCCGTGPAHVRAISGAFRAAG